MNISDKLKYVLIAVVSVLLVCSSAFAVYFGIGYYSVMEKLNTSYSDTQSAGEKASDGHQPCLSQFEHIIDEAEHIVSREYALGYFDDAVFVGDSRTEGLFLYSEIAQKTNAVAYAWRGFTTNDIINNKKFKIDGKYLTGIQALESNKNFSKVYIMLGVNELSPGGADEFIERYDQIVSCALKANPHARIVIQSIIPLAKWKSQESDYVNNQNTADFNAALFNYAEKNGYIWLDVGSVLSDGQGNLKSVYDCGDGIHLTDEACDVWLDYLCYYTYL